MSKFIFAFLGSCVLLISCTQTDDQILRKTLSTLNDINTIEYQSVYNYHYDLENRNDTAICYFDFTSKDTLIGAKYQFLHNRYLSVFNGHTWFSLDKNINTIFYNNKPQNEDVINEVFLFHSIWEFKKLLPVFLDDSTIYINRQQDTIINGERNYAFNILIKDRFIDLGSKLSEIKKTTLHYLLFISKKTYLPTQFSFIDETENLLCYSFSKYKIPASRPDTIWSYDNLPQKYLRLTINEYMESVGNKANVQIGQNAIDWNLPLIDSHDSIQLSKQKGNLVFLEFWFIGCKGCIQAIPEINGINDGYSQRGLKVYGVDFGQSNIRKLADYIKKQNIEYPVLHSGKNVAKIYGVSAAPTFFLIDKKGVIVYSSLGLNKEELIKAIEDNL